MHPLTFTIPFRDINEFLRKEHPRETPEEHALRIAEQTGLTHAEAAAIVERLWDAGDNYLPYAGTEHRGIAHEEIYATLCDIETNGPHSTIIPRDVYGCRLAIRELTALLPPSGKTQRLMDIGMGTGTSTLVLAQAYPNARITGIDHSPAMLEIAGYKFGITSGNNLLQHASPQVQERWNAFRASVTDAMRQRLTLLFGSIEYTDLPKESFDGGAAIQALHWTDLRKSFVEIARLLKRGGWLVWTSAGHFVRNPPEFKNFRRQRYHTLVGKVFRYFNERLGIDLGDYRTLAQPPQSIEGLVDTAQECGLKTLHLGTNLTQESPMGFLWTQIPHYVRMALTQQPHTLSEEEIAAGIRKAIKTHIADKDVVQDTMRIYEHIPMFMSKKQ